MFVQVQNLSLRFNKVIFKLTKTNYEFCAGQVNRSLNSNCFNFSGLAYNSFLSLILPVWPDHQLKPLCEIMVDNKDNKLNSLVAQMKIGFPFVILSGQRPNKQSNQALNLY